MHFSLRPHGGRRERGSSGTVRSPPAPRTVGSPGRRKALWDCSSSFLCSHVARSMAVLVAGAWWAAMEWESEVSAAASGRYGPFPKEGETARTRWPCEGPAGPV
ncbi:hypothetical protein NN561_017366 [Cricetulus griseus]